MQIHQTARLTILAICLTISAATVIAFSQVGYSITPATAQEEDRKNKRVEGELIPLVRLSTQEPITQRDVRGGHGRPIAEMPNITDITESESWIERLPALPIEKSDAVIIGIVTQAEAHLSTDNSSVYSEYTIAVDEVLSVKSDLSLGSGRTLIATREGGRVQFPSGHTQTYRLSGQGFLQPNQKYVVFLKENKEKQDFLLITGYQLQKGQVIPVDRVTSHTVYEGTHETDFINTVRTAIAVAGKGAGR